MVKLGRLMSQALTCRIDTWPITCVGLTATFRNKEKVVPTKNSVPLFKATGSLFSGGLKLRINSNLFCAGVWNFSAF